MCRKLSDGSVVSVLVLLVAAFPVFAHGRLSRVLSTRGLWREIESLGCTAVWVLVALMLRDDKE
jgi:hypothetical protein